MNAAGEAGSAVVQTIDAVRRPQTGRIPPHNLEAEESLLGAMLLSRDAITAAVEARVDVVRLLQARARPHLRRGPVALRAGRAGRPGHRRRGAAARRSARALGGRPALLQIQASTPASANAGHYARDRQRARAAAPAHRGRGRHLGDGLRHSRRRRRDARPRRGAGLRGRRTPRVGDDGQHPRRAPGDARPARGAATATTPSSPVCPPATPISTRSCSGSSREPRDRRGPPRYGQDQLRARHGAQRRHVDAAGPSSSSRWRWARSSSRSACSRSEARVDATQL